MFSVCSVGSSIISFRQRRDIAVVLPFLILSMNSSVKLNSSNVMYHHTIIGLEASLMNNKIR